MRVLAEQELAGQAEAASRRFRGNAGEHARWNAEVVAAIGKAATIIADQDRSAGQVGEDLLQPGQRGGDPGQRARVGRVQGGLALGIAILPRLAVAAGDRRITVRDLPHGLDLARDVYAVARTASVRRPSVAVIVTALRAAGPRRHRAA